MAVDSSALVTYEYVQNYIGMEGIEPDAQEVIEGLINAVSKIVENYTRRKFKSEQRTEYYDGDGTYILIPRYYPITAVSSLYDDVDRAYTEDTKLTVTDYCIKDERTIELYDELTFNEGQNNIKLTYTAGYSQTPFDLSQAVCEQVTYKYQEGRAAKILGVTGKTYPDFSVNYTVADLLPQVKIVLNMYKNIRV